MTLAGLFPELEITLLDPNVAQLDLVQRKLEALLGFDEPARLERFNVEDDDPEGLSECGNFEALFRGLRTFVHDMVWPRERWRSAFEQGSLDDLAARVFAGPYWSVAFELFFSDRLLSTMFGPAATQHATPGSYPRYFQRLFERGLSRPDAVHNPFLHHVFLGHYLRRAEALPSFLRKPPRAPRFTFVAGYLEAGVDLAEFDFVGLSNIMDWMPGADVAALFEKVRREMRSGSVVMWRQLNNARDLQGALGPGFAFDADRQRRLHASDKSLFYSSIHVGVCR